MKIVAITTEGKEFLFNVRTAHKVSNAGCMKICKILNRVKWKLNKPAEKWWVYDVDEYDMAYDVASTQTFKLTGKGLVEKGV